MLSSRKTRFQWSKQDRGSDVPLFRSMAQRWKPTVHHRDPDLTEAIKSPSPSPEPRPAETPSWTPWLWVD